MGHLVESGAATARDVEPDPALGLKRLQVVIVSADVSIHTIREDRQQRGDQIRTIFVVAVRVNGMVAVDHFPPGLACRELSVQPFPLFLASATLCVSSAKNCTGPAVKV